MASDSVGDLQLQLEATIRVLAAKDQASGEPIVNDYLSRYREALGGLRLGEGEAVFLKKLRKLLNMARGYLETSSEWDQDFLHEIAKTEKMVQAYLKSRP